MKTCFCHLTVVCHPLADERLAISMQIRNLYIAGKYI